jgi:Coenzyme PQQ synthesis protein D (PqqD)
MMGGVLMRASGLDVNEVPDGYIIYQVAADRVHYLNTTAAIVFELCDGARDSDDIVSRIKKIFDGAGHNEVEACIESLLKEGLVQRSE